jgi:hypothetical protein
MVRLDGNDTRQVQAICVVRLNVNDIQIDGFRFIQMTASMQR